ncbi:hypothetical protein J6590_002784 [Homalodisca vitripennis]|nr:hypothetical protein J6590_002784 [Homalodisca vitripennis]
MITVSEHLFSSTLEDARRGRQSEADPSLTTGSCDRIQCSEKKYCLLDQNLSPHCVRCSRRCSPGQHPRPVCGIDRRTYHSSCHIRRAACRRGKSIPIAYKDKCIPLFARLCDYFARITRQDKTGRNNSYESASVIKQASMHDGIWHEFRLIVGNDVVNAGTTIHRRSRYSSNDDPQREIADDIP